MKIDFTTPYKPSKATKASYERMLTAIALKDRIFYLKSYWIAGGFQKELGVITRPKVVWVLDVHKNTVDRHWNYEPVEATTINPNKEEIKKEVIYEPILEEIPVRKVSYSIDKIDALKELILAHQSKLESIATMQKEADDLKLEIEKAHKDLL